MLGGKCMDTNLSEEVAEKSLPQNRLRRPKPAIRRSRINRRSPLKPSIEPKDYQILGCTSDVKFDQ